MKVIGWAAAVGAALVLGHAAPAAAQQGHGMVYTATNDPGGNHIVAFTRAADGTLTAAGAFATGGLGSGDGLGNQGGVRLTADGRFLLVVNAGSADLSVLEVTASGLTLRDRRAAGGLRPVSVAVNGRLVYVLNNGAMLGDVDVLTGFHLSRDGALTPIAGSARGLSAASVGPAQVEFSPDGGTLVVTEKNTNRIDLFAVRDDGLLDGGVSAASAGQTPFGFAFGKRGEFFVSEAFGGAADASAVSSYRLIADTAFATVTPSAPTTETSACWVVVSGDGRVLYTTNAASGTITGYDIRPDGTIERLDADGVTSVSGPGPTDLGLSLNSRFLYVLHAGTGAITGYRVEAHGGLTPLGAIEVPVGSNGIAVQ
jgi:6-phosphogluconolactonase (cycloisomerase 2 family)